LKQATLQVADASKYIENKSMSIASPELLQELLYTVDPSSEVWSRINKKLRGALAVRRYRARHPEKVHACVAAWRMKNPEKSKESDKKSQHARLTQRRLAAHTRYNSERNGAKCKAWREKNPEKRRKSRYDSLYGRGAYEHFQQQLESQSRQCAICGNPFISSFTTHRDHNHGTKQWRGVLCNGCNAGLGNFKENADTLAKAIAYLRYWEKL